MIECFSVKIPKRAIKDLKSRLKQTRWTDEILNSEWSYGSILSFMKELTEYWPK
jgi:Epoxide hydrolase N terminus